MAAFAAHCATRSQHDLLGSPIATAAHATGGDFAGVVLVPSEALEISGDYTEYVALRDSGHQVSWGFCPQCGTTVFAHTTRVESMRPVYAVSFDQPGQFVPTLDAWVDFAQP